jgi:hypothetical protein
MYKKECKWCNKIIEVEKQCLFALHISNCDSNPNKKIRLENSSKKLKGKEKIKRIRLKLHCPKCNTEFEIRITESEFRRNKYRKYCSEKCSKSRIRTDEIKKKISDSCKKSEKVKIANRIITERRKHRSYKSTKRYTEYICQYCGESGIDDRYNKNKKYHYDCWKKGIWWLKRR